MQTIELFWNYLLKEEHSYSGQNKNEAGPLL
jgi:hypothetical protein